MKPGITQEGTGTSINARVFGVTLCPMLFALGLVGALLFALCSSAVAQQAKVYRVGVLVVGGADIPQIKGLRDGLKNHGYIQGKNLDLEVFAKESYGEYRPLIKSYKEKKVDALVSCANS